MPGDQFSILLTEVRDLRKDHNEFARSVTADLAAVKQDVKGLVGNGRPGRVSKLEDDVAALQKSKYYAWGFAGAIGAVAGFFAHFVPAFLK
jgi:hypothetical protein